jgi:ribosomal protein L36
VYSLADWVRATASVVISTRGGADLGLAVPDLHEAGVVRHHDLELAGGLGPEEPGLDRGVADLLAGLVDDPGAHVVEERAPVVGEDGLLFELEGTPSEAEDVVQTALIRCYRHWERVIGAGDTTAGAPSPTTPPTTPTDSPAATSPAATDQPKTAAACEGPMSAPVALVEVNPDTSKPRCLVVRRDQRLRVLNTTSRFGQRGTPVVVTFARWSPQTLDPGESITFNAPVGQVLDLGVHDLRLEVGGQHWATDVWVKEALDATADPSPRAIRVVVPSHCGVLSVRVHDVLWLADPPLGDHNPPPGWDENETPGYLTRDGTADGNLPG